MAPLRRALGGRCRSEARGTDRAARRDRAVRGANAATRQAIAAAADRLRRRDRARARARPGLRQRQLPLRGAQAAARPGEGGHHLRRHQRRDGAASRRSGRSSSTGSRSTPTPTSWPRWWSGSATSSGCTTTASACRPTRSSSRSHNIQRMDAILDLTTTAAARSSRTGRRPTSSSATRRSWAASCCARSFGDDYVDALFAPVRRPRAARGRPGDATGSSGPASRSTAGRTKRAGLLATQGIRGGANRRVLERIKADRRHLLRLGDRDWVLDGADVHVSMVGFDDGTRPQRRLDGAPVPIDQRQPDGRVRLTGRATPAREPRDSPSWATPRAGPSTSRRSSPRDADAPLEPNGRPNSDVVRPWVNGLDITRRPRGMWIIDFGVDMPEADAALYEQPFEYVGEHVKPGARDESAGGLSRAGGSTRSHGPRCAPRCDGRPRFIATPTRREASPLRVDRRAQTLPDMQLIVVARDDDYFFGVLHSESHELWALRHGHVAWDGKSRGTRRRPPSRPSPSRGRRAEPADDPRVEAIAEAARELVERRDAGSTRRSAARPTRSGGPSPTSTTSARPGWTWPTRRSTRPSSPPTAGRPTSATPISWSGCWR